MERVHKVTSDLSLHKWWYEIDHIQRPVHIVTYDHILTNINSLSDITIERYFLWMLDILVKPMLYISVMYQI